MKLYNGQEATKENVLAMLREPEQGQDDMTDTEKTVIKKVAGQNYEGAEEDLNCLVEKLNAVHGAGEMKNMPFYPQANWQTVYDILNEGYWNYMDDMYYKK